MIQAMITRNPAGQCQLRLTGHADSGAWTRHRLRSGSVLAISTINGIEQVAPQTSDSKWWD